ncbi:Flagellar motor switch protein FliG [Buchnera aphidicola (Eriosoma lanigerum)]|uniref:FliG C-terminal domain-containing protein n=1 Tax=Buchnera aphidicola TaxID=9 RepID=UPI0034643FAA
MTTKLTGKEKSALLLLSMGTEEASQVLQYLSASEIQILISTILQITKKEPKYISVALSEFKKINYQQDISNVNMYQDNLLSMLRKALGHTDAIQLFDDALAVQNKKDNLNILNNLNLNELMLLIKNEHIQIIVILLISIPHHRSVQLFELLDSKMQIEVMLRITKCNKISRRVLIEFSKFINQLLNFKHYSFQNIHGLQVSSEILKSIKKSDQKKILTEIYICDKNIFHKIIVQIFSFEHIIDLDNINIKFLIKNINKEKLFFLLQYSDKTLQEKFLNLMTKVDVDLFYKNYSTKKNISNSIIQQERTEMVNLIKSYLDSKKMSFSMIG